MNSIGVKFSMFSERQTQSFLILSDFRNDNHFTDRAILLAKKNLQSMLPLNTSSYLHLSLSDEKDFVNAVVIIEAR